MPRNTYISLGPRNEQRLYEDLIIEALKIYGHDVYYIPRKIVNEDAIFREDVLSSFGSAYMIETYVASNDGFQGDGDLLSKFGVEIRNQIDIVISRRRWEQLVGRFRKPDEKNGTMRPNEGDLIYFPLFRALFEIKFVEDKSPFYQLNNLPTYTMTCESFEYNNQNIDTGVEDIDEIERGEGELYSLTISSPLGTFEIGEDIRSTPGNIEAEVASVINNENGTVTLKLVGLSGKFTEGDTIIALKTASSGTIDSFESFESLSDNDPSAMNSTFEEEGNDFIDFTVLNPFGEPNTIT